MFVRRRSGEGVFISRAGYSNDHALYKALLIATHPSFKGTLQDYYRVGSVQDVELSFKQQLHKLHRKKGQPSRYTANSQR